MPVAVSGLWHCCYGESCLPYVSRRDWYCLWWMIYVSSLAGLSIRGIRYPSCYPTLFMNIQLKKKQIKLKAPGWRRYELLPAGFLMNQESSTHISTPHLQKNKKTCALTLQCCLQLLRQKCASSSRWLTIHSWLALKETFLVLCFFQLLFPSHRSWFVA